MKLGRVSLASWSEYISDISSPTASYIPTQKHLSLSRFYVVLSPVVPCDHVHYQALVLSGKLATGAGDIHLHWCPQLHGTTTHLALLLEGLRTILPLYRSGGVTGQFET